MTIVRRELGDKQPEVPKRSPDPLPLRWALILAIAVAVGLLLGNVVSIVAGITVGVAVVGLLHKILD